MCYVNIYSKLKELIGQKAEFYSLQEKTIYTIITRQSLIVSVIATSKGKSLLFILLVYCINRGTTVVIILLYSLQEDLERQYKDAYIEYI